MYDSAETGSDTTFGTIYHNVFDVFEKIVNDCLLKKICSRTNDRPTNLNR